MRTWEPYHAPDLVHSAKVCPKCGERPVLKKDPVAWVFVFGCPNACALQTDEIQLSRNGSEETRSYELGYGFDNMKTRFLAWWNEL